MRRRPRWKNLGLRTKLAVLIEGLLLLLALATGLLATGRMESTLESELTRRGLAIAGDLAMFSVKPLLAGDLATLRRFVNHTMSHDHVRSVAVLDPDGTVVMHSDLARVGERPDDAWTRRALASPTPGHEDSLAARAVDPVYGLHVPITASGARLGTVVVGYSRAAVRAEIGRARRQIASVWVLAAVLSGGLAWLLASYVARPITAIAAAMQGAAGGELRAVLAEGRRDEVGVLASSFNEMTEDLARHRQHLSDLVEARTAELRDANARLEEEIAERERVAGELRRSQEELRGLTSHLQSIREQERTEIAREIHDELGQSLTALKLDLHWVGQQLALGRPAEAGPRIAGMSKAIDGTVHAVRRISSRLRPKLLDDLGLSAALEWEAREFEERTRVACRIRSEPDDIVLDPARSTALFRIFQETLTNVARHARASRVEVRLSDFEGRVEMTVSDDGEGIRPEQVSDRRSLGLVGMRERVRSLGGRLEITGRRGRGTTVRVSIPCPVEVAAP
jgi:signal transduction histidine kinase